MFSAANQILGATVKRRLSYFILTLFSQLLEPHNIEPCNGMDRLDSNPKECNLSQKKFLFQFLPEKPNEDYLSRIKGEKIALYAEEGKLYCEILGKDRIEITVDNGSTSATRTRKGLPKEVFEKIKYCLANIITDTSTFRFCLGMEERHVPIVIWQYTDAYKSIGNDELSTVFDFMFSCGYLSMSPSSKKTRFGGEDERPKKKIRLEDSVFHSFLELPSEMQSLVLWQIQNPTAILKLVCKEFDRFCEQNRLVAWKFNPANYPSFQKEKNSEWVEQALGKVYSLSFINPIDDSRLDDNMPEEEWCSKNIFLSREDFEHINRKAVNLKKLIIFNIPCMGRYLNYQAPYAPSLVSFEFDFDPSIFKAIPSEEFIGCTQFTNLKNIDIPFDIFSQNGKISDSFSSLTNLENLTLKNVMDDGGWELYSTNLFKSLTSLRKLKDLIIYGTPNFSAFENLSSLTSLESLELHFTEPMEEKQGNLHSIIFNYLPNLKSISIDEDYCNCNLPPDIM